MFYKPPEGFIKDLKNKDYRLDCVYYPQAERFVITYARANGKPVEVRVIKTEDEQFRWPDQRDIKWLADHDMSNTSLREQLDQTAKIIEEVREQDEKRRRTAIAEATVDGKYTLKDWYYKNIDGNAKGHHPFRRIAPKKKGKTIEEFKIIDKRKIKN
jgi:hypothetical protein